MYKFNFVILICTASILALAGCSKSLGPDRSQPNKNRNLNAASKLRYGAMTDAELVTKAQASQLGKCTVKDVTSEKSTCQSGASFAVFITDTTKFYPSDTTEPADSAVCLDALGANLREAIKADICYSAPPAPAGAK